MNIKDQLIKIIWQHHFNENDVRKKTQKPNLKVFALDEFWFTAFPKAEEIENEKY